MNKIINKTTYNN